MKRRLGYLRLAIVIGLSAVVGPAGSLAARETTTIIPVETMVRKPRTDGTTVVWTQFRDSDGWGQTFWDVYGARVDHARAFPIATGPAGSRSDPVVDGGLVVWAESSGQCEICNRNILGKDLASGRQFVIADTAEDETRPVLSGTLVVWVSDNGATRRLLGRDLRTMDDPFVIAANLSHAHRPELDGDRLVWAEQRPAEAAHIAPDFRLLTRRIGDGEPVVVAEYGSGFGSGALVGQPDIFAVAGGVVAYRTADNVRVADPRSGVSRRLDLPTRGDSQALATDGRYVFVDMRPLRGDTTLAGYDLATDSAFVAATASFAPHLRHDILIWQSGRSPTPGIHITRPVDVLPTARRPAPDQPSPERTYFAETGHALAYGFKSFWEGSGGLPVFGYPLTEEFDQFNHETAAMHAVQFTERQRFEYHPQHQGTPYEVQLGRLGLAEAEQRHLLTTWAFQPLPADQAPRADCTYLPAVQHRLCGEFRPYWEGHGLEFGDPGVSFRESLALFGYPISEEFIDPETGLITQYFERAVFEYHPTNAVPHRVLLRRLAADRLAQWGW